MGAINRTNEGLEYIDRNPVCKKWINECICCHRIGYSPEMPEKITPDEFGFNYSNLIRSYFEPLVLNDNGVCEVCEKLIKI